MRCPGDGANLDSMHVDDKDRRPRYLACRVCGYGARVAGDAPPYPMCGSTSWRVDGGCERAKERTMPWNSDLRADVEEQLAWEPDIDANAIAVLVLDGHVTLRGTVGSVEEKRTAERIAAQVFGVVAIEDRLEVRRLDSQRRKDAGLRAEILQALMLDDLVPASIDVKVEDGVVALTGYANWQYQPEAAKLAVAHSIGELEIVDEITVVDPARPTVDHA
jgi:osmotically-inducible protein OsmY